MRMRALQLSVVLLAGCGTSDRCDFAPSERLICPEVNCIATCRDDRASCQELCQRGSCYRCERGRWVTQFYECDPACR